MGAENIYYNPSWVKATIDELEQELRLVNVLQRDWQELRRQMAENGEMPPDILLDLEALEKSLLATQKALQSYLESSERNVATASSVYEDELKKTSKLF